MPIELIAPVILFIFGAVLGSFLNVVILRNEAVSHKKQSVVRGRSRCMGCKRTLRWRELMPLASFTFLRGRCARCGVPLSVQYPVVELTMGLLVVVLGTPLPHSTAAAALVPLIVIVGLLLVLFVIDLKTMLLPDELVFTLLGVVVVYVLVRSFSATSDLAVALLEAVIGAGIGGGLLWLLWFATRGKGLGFGDVKLALPLGAMVGPWGIITLLFGAFVIGGVLGAMLLLLRQVKPHTAVPFGPFLIGVALVLLIKPELITLFQTMVLGR